MTSASDAPAAPTTDDPIAPLARRCWAALETVHITAYFAAEPAAEYRALGMRGRHGYFASRSAPMGAVPTEVTVATFYVWSPALVRQAIPAAWQLASPSEILAARHRGAAAALHRILGDPDVAEAVELARTACAGLSAPGRPLYAGHASLPWPDDPLLALWHAASLLREHRGDGHIAALLLADLDPVEAIISYGLAAGATEFMRSTRGWTDEEWAAGENRLRQRGLLDAAGLTEAGTALRAQLEAQTARAAESGWRHLGVEGATRLLELVTPIRQALRDSDIFPDWLYRRR